MALGVVKKDEFEAELNRLNDSGPTAQIIDMKQKGRKEGDINVPDELRNIIAETAVTDGRKAAVDLAESMGISKSSASAYAHGANSTASYHHPTPTLQKTITDATGRIVKRAKSKINMAIQHITDEKLKEAKPVDLAAIARNLGAVVRNMEPEKPVTNNHQGPTFVFYTPPQRKEETYNVIDLKE